MHTADGRLDLVIQDAPVGDDDNRVERRMAVLAKANKLVGEPRDGIRFPAARGVLDQITLASPNPRHVGEQAPHHFQLMESGEHLLSFLPASLGVGNLDNLSVVFDDVRQPAWCQNPLPQVVRLNAVGIRRVAGGVLVPLVERQKPGELPFQLGAHLHALIVHGEMDHASAEPEQQLARIAVPLVLLFGVLHSLLRQAVLELERCYGQAVDEQA